MRYFNTFVLLVFTLFLTSFNSNCYSQYKLKTIVIDAGHGGKDPGSIGKKSYEKNKKFWRLRLSNSQFPQEI